MSSLLHKITSITTYWLVLLVLAQTVSSGWFHEEPTKTTNHHDIRQLRTVHEMVTIEEQITVEELVTVHEIVTIEELSTVEELVTVYDVLTVEENAYKSSGLFVRAPASPKYGDIGDIMSKIAAKNVVPHEANIPPKGTATVTQSITGNVPVLGNSKSIMAGIKAAGVKNEEDEDTKPTDVEKSPDCDSENDSDNKGEAGKDQSPSPTDCDSENNPGKDETGKNQSPSPTATDCDSENNPGNKDGESPSPTNSDDVKYTPCASYTTVEGIKITFPNASSCPVDNKEPDNTTTDDCDSDEEGKDGNDSNCAFIHVTLGTNVITFSATDGCKPTGAVENPYKLDPINPYANNESPKNNPNSQSLSASTGAAAKGLLAKPIMGEMGYRKGETDTSALQCTDKPRPTS